MTKLALVTGATSGIGHEDRLRQLAAQDVVTASLRGLELGEVVCAPGVEDTSLLDAVFAADLSAFAGQSPQLASRYRTT